MSKENKTKEKLSKEDFIEFWKTVRTDAISAMFDNVGENGIYPTGVFFKSIDSSFETALTEYAKIKSRERAIAFNEWMQRYSLYDYSKHPYKYCVRQQPNGGHGKPETWTADQLYDKFNLFIQQTENNE